jgi:hypothetical protein
MGGAVTGTEGLRQCLVGKRQRRWRHFRFVLGDRKFASARICETKYREIDISNAPIPFRPIEQ